MSKTTSNSSVHKKVLLLLLLFPLPSSSPSFTPPMKSRHRRPPRLAESRAYSYIVFTIAQGIVSAARPREKR